MSQNGKVKQPMPEPEVVPRADRRYYSQEYKERILDEIDRAQEPGANGAILRREGLYSQIISKWRQQRRHGTLASTPTAKRGPKPEPHKNELQRLQRENEQLRTRLERAEIIIEVQKKVSLLLGMQESDRQEPK